MRVATIVVLAVALLVAASVAGYCQTARSVGMGMTGVGLADDAAAWLFNPAGLADLKVAPKADDVSWTAIAGQQFDTDSPLSEKFVHVAGAYGPQGFAVGYIRLADVDSTVWGGGYGFKYNQSLSFGASIIQGRTKGSSLYDLTSSAAAAGTTTTQTFVDLGAMYQWKPSWGAGNPAKLSLVAFDTFGKVQTLWAAGFSTNIGSKLLVDVDVLDLRDKTAVDGVDKSGRMVDYGAEYPVADWLTLRAGSQDGDFGFGAGFVVGDGWKIDVGHIKLDPGGSYEPKQTLFSIGRDF
jgi:hypothetical protein